MVVLIAVIIKTRKHGVIAWKNSALALVFLELRGWETPASKIVVAKESDRRATEMRGILFGVGDILAFTKRGLILL